MIQSKLPHVGTTIFSVMSKLVAEHNAINLSQGFLNFLVDKRFPEISRNKLNKENKPFYDLMLYVANWPAKRSLNWKSLLAARALENQSYVIGVNRVGEDGKGLSYSGDSNLTDSLGIVSSLTPFSGQFNTFTLYFSYLQSIRENLPFLKDQ